MELQDMHKILVTWRGKQFSVVVKPNSYVKELGEELQELTNVKRETLRLFVPHPHNKGSKVVMPFSDSFSSLTLQEAAIIQGKPIRMMGVSHEEIEEVSQDHTKPDLRIIGFDEEEKRLRQRAGYRSQTPLKLPQGPYIFCEFRALHIPGIELNPPPSEALRRLHMLACDPGIIAIMNKHRWRVGVMTEMAPEGYVGISPKCILGFNKNQGEEISLRLRTDDLKGFRKYEGIKKTLLHELAHMVHSEHDSNFFALNKQLNDEAAKLDWTKSQSHMLSGQKSFSSDQYDDFIGRNIIVGHKLGGTLNPFASARSSSAAAAVSRLVNASNTDLGVSEGDAHALATRMPYTATEPDPDVSELTGDTKCRDVELDLDNPESVSNAVLHGNITAYRASKSSLVDERHDVPDPYDSCDKMMLEPEPDDSLDNETMLERDPDDSLNNQNMLEPDPDDSLNSQQMLEPDPDDPLNFQTMLEPDPDDSLVSKKITEPDPDDSLVSKKITEPDPDDSLSSKQIRKPDPDGSQAKGCVLSSSEPDPDDSLAAQVTYFIDEPDSVGTGFIKIDLNNQNISEPDPDDSIRDCTFNTQKEVHHDFESHNSELLQTVAEPAATVCSRIQKAVNMLRSEATPPEAATALQTLFKIIRNVIEHPGDTRFKRLRKANPQFQRNVANYKAAMEVLSIVGFCEDVVHDEIGRAETFMVLKRNDPGLLWLAKSSIEMSIA